ncbi:MAG: DNA methylase [Ignavibacteria bacterium RIFOXYB2_FULL_35_12]|nr:MAG: DNA methylase [Ignavibacteria bacterium GWA2_36_19]OGU62649.1 MAG: DNA methylase [Ignavibacteria bacterium GWF2_35_20]OGU79415.1 MAG: DNA methylase [Ignavibacteria bacterium RIFOXYA2_FULL_35_9]OGU89671.1 MAG: DNA methylase [Ignavibacteria bacterium RIFOXYA12_FULL_35_25]OGU94709.1 MAG: DNA methylase [Ignavibacteria bacterium RIFOXYB12_FULL_35_14]OGV01696.1 MAG: DNA methylase [Ignavibacteria bacterium RIFOXYC2_FULL_35_16]OGV03997.1 MAG: DNA methylase [Ignavibacteria bacterium RIFOXYB2_F
MNEELRKKILPHCRLKEGEIWTDPKGKHKIGCLDATSNNDTKKLFGKEKAQLVINDPPYNVVVGNANTKSLSKMDIKKYMDFSKNWVQNVVSILDKNASLYIWLGADQNDGFQPLPEFMIMMRELKELSSRSFITMRNQRGYGTQKNWMAVRQELLYYIKGEPPFTVIYTDIPKILRGYYKEINGKVTENFERSKSLNIRPGNVWVDIQQVFYRMEENIPGAYAQKPLKSISRIVEASSKKNDLVADFFSHSGATLIAAEQLERGCYAMELDIVFAELSIRRLEYYRKTGKTGWQLNNPFPEVKV